jgi:hypothetical protein
MHIHLPKPLHGWREFAGEVGIIVLGVSIALGAEQLIQTIHSQREVAQFRTAVDLELATTLAAYRYRVDQEPCVKRRLGELRKWLDTSRAGTPLPPAGEIGRPSLYSFLTSVWKSSSPNVMNNLTLDTRERYAGLYDFAGLVDGQLDQEAEIWRSLNAFNGASQLSPEDRRKIADLAYRAKSFDDLVVSNYPWFKQNAAEMDIAPAWGNRRKFVTPPDPAFCRPLFPASSRH